MDEEGGKRGDGPEKMTEAGPTSEKGGKTVRNYELLEVLGEGSYGIVYKAKDTRSGNMVALKKFKASIGFQRIQQSWKKGLPGEERGC